MAYLLAVGAPPFLHYVRHPPARLLCLHFTVFRDISPGERNASARPCLSEHNISPSHRSVRAPYTTALRKLFFLTQARTQKWRQTDCEANLSCGDFSADPRLISRFLAAVALSEKILLVETTTRSCCGRRLLP